jgi:hypothetical protein
MSGSRRSFALHYVEMVVVMVLGMLILGRPIDYLVSANGIGPMLIKMATSMTIPMVAWMHFRGHTWRPCLEMAASMIMPLLGTLALLGAGIVVGAGPLMVIMHGVMLPAMLVAMLLRREEYSCHHRGGEELAPTS